MSARKQPLMLMITTSGTIRECIYDDVYDYASKIVDGIIINDRYLPIMYELDTRDEWTDPTKWQKANPALGIIKKLNDLQEKVEKAKSSPKDLPGILTKDFNIRDTVAGMWLTFDDVNNETVFNLDDFRDSYCVGGVDLSSTTDLTCATLTMMKPDSDMKYAIQMYFLPEELIEKREAEDKIPYRAWKTRGLLRTTEGAKVNYSNVTAWFMEMFNDYGLRPLWIGYDSWNSQYWIQEMKDSGFTMQEVRMGYKTLSQPMKEMGADLMNNLINYNNNPILKWNLTNVAIKADQNENIVPVKGLSKRARIDGAVSLLISYAVLFEHMQDYKAMI
jgi:phage terminase large subunit-like protein